MVASSGDRHLEAAVAGDGPDFFFRAGDLGADSRRQSEAHRAESAGGDQRARLVVLVVLRFPHLVLAHIGDDDGVALGGMPEIVDDVRGVQMAVVGKVLDIADCAVAFLASIVVQPCVPIARREYAAEESQGPACRSPMRATSTLTFLLISAGSISM